MFQEAKQEGQRCGTLSNIQLFALWSCMNHPTVCEGTSLGSLKALATLLLNASDDERNRAAMEAWGPDEINFDADGDPILTEDDENKIQEACERLDNVIEFSGSVAMREQKQ